MPRSIWAAIKQRVAKVFVVVSLQYRDYLDKPHSLDCEFVSNGATKEFSFIAGTRKSN